MESWVPVINDAPRPAVDWFRLSVDPAFRSSWLVRQQSAMTTWESQQGVALGDPAQRPWLMQPVASEAANVLSGLIQQIETSAKHLTPTEEPPKAKSDNGRSYNPRARRDRLMALAVEVFGALGTGLSDLAAFFPQPQCRRLLEGVASLPALRPRLRGLLHRWNLSRILDGDDSTGINENKSLEALETMLKSPPALSPALQTQLHYELGLFHWFRARLEFGVKYLNVAACLWRGTELTADAVAATEPEDSSPEPGLAADSDRSLLTLTFSDISSALRAVLLAVDAQEAAKGDRPAKRPPDAELTAALLEGVAAAAPTRPRSGSRAVRSFAISRTAWWLARKDLSWAEARPRFLSLVSSVVNELLGPRETAVLHPASAPGRFPPSPFADALRGLATAAALFSEPTNPVPPPGVVQYLARDPDGGLMLLKTLGSVAGPGGPELRLKLLRLSQALGSFATASKFLALASELAPSLPDTSKKRPPAGPPDGAQPPAPKMPAPASAVMARLEAVQGPPTSLASAKMLLAGGSAQRARAMFALLEPGREVAYGLAMAAIRSGAAFAKVDALIGQALSTHPLPEVWSNAWVLEDFVTYYLNAGAGRPLAALAPIFSTFTVPAWVLFVQTAEALAGLIEPRPESGPVSSPLKTVFEGAGSGSSRVNWGLLDLEALAGVGSGVSPRGVVGASPPPADAVLWAPSSGEPLGSSRSPFWPLAKLSNIKLIRDLAAGSASALASLPRAPPETDGIDPTRFGDSPAAKAWSASPGQSWPGKVTKAALLSFHSQVLARAALIEPWNPVWLVGLADAAFWRHETATSLKLFLLAGAVESGYYSTPDYKIRESAVFRPVTLTRMSAAASAVGLALPAVLLAQIGAWRADGLPSGPPTNENVATARAQFSSLSAAAGSLDTAYFKFVWDIPLLELLLHLYASSDDTLREAAILSVLGNPSLNEANPIEIRTKQAESSALGALCQLYHDVWT